MAEVRQRWAFPELVDRIRNGPARFSVFAIPGVDEGANTTEFFVHHEDVRRAGDRAADRPGPGSGGRGVDVAAAQAAGPGLVPPGPGGGGAGAAGLGRRRGEPETIRAVSGASIVTLVGQPSELMLYAHGRTSVAEIKLVGEPEAIEILNSTDLRRLGSCSGDEIGQ